jgi:hypothetical protein
MTPFNLWRAPIYEHESQLTFYLKASGIYYRYTWLREHPYIGRKIRAFKQYLSRESS